MICVYMSVIITVIIIIIIVAAIAIVIVIIVSGLTIRIIIIVVSFTICLCILCRLLPVDGSRVCSLQTTSTKPPEVRRKVSKHVFKPLPN